MSIKNGFFRASAEDFSTVPGRTIAYWLSDEMRKDFSNGTLLEEVAQPKQGISTTDNNRFVRLWPEVSISSIGFNLSNASETFSDVFHWFPLNKGGEFRKWAGNRFSVVNYSRNGQEIKENVLRKYPYLTTPDFVVKNSSFYFRRAISWSKIASNRLCFRLYPTGFIFSDAGMAMFAEQENESALFGFLNSKVAQSAILALAPTFNFEAGHISRLPILPSILKPNFSQEVIEHLVSLSVADWDSYETSWDFKENPLVAEARHFGEIMLSDVYDVVRINWAKATVKMRELEIRNNEIFIKAYGLEGELSPDVPWNEVSLTCNPWYRYGREVPENVDAGIYGVASEMPMDADLEKRLRADTAKELISYAVGCMMGRYSLDRPGLVLADAGGTLADYRAKLREAGVGAPRFEPDEDGIIPILDADWFEDDVVTRFHAFLRAAFGEASFHANIAWLEDALGKDLRTYFVKDFYADHVQRYQKRPIYWLFSSRRGAFQALVYLHRYRPDTPGRVLGYLRSYIAKVAARIEALDRIATDSSAARGTRTAALRARTKLAKAQAEIADYERDVLYPLSTTA